jgi:hypothetical protein
MKSSSLLDWKRAKGSLPEKAPRIYKKRIAYSRLEMTMQKGKMKSMMVMMMSENQLC